MKVDVESLSPVTKQITVEIDAERVDKEFEDSWRAIARSNPIKGFRPGKVPRSLLVKRFGATLATDIGERLVEETAAKALQEASVEAVGILAIDKAPAAQGSPYRYSIKVDIAPEFGPISLEGLTIPQLDHSASDEEIEGRLEELRRSRAELVPVEDGGADTGDIVTIDFVGRLGDEPFKGGSGEGHDLELGSGSFIPGFEDQLLGIRAGEARTLSISFPADYHAAHLAGQEAYFDVTAQKVRRREIPELDDDLARDMDHESLDALRDKLRAEIQEQKATDAKGATTERLLDQLVAREDFMVPQTLVEDRAQMLAEHMAGEMQRQGIDIEKLGLGGPEARDMFLARGERVVREALLVEAIAQQNGLSADDADVDAYLESLAERSGRAAQFVRSLWGDASRRNGLKSQLLREKVLDFLRSRATVEPAKAPDTEEPVTTEGNEE